MSGNEFEHFCADVLKENGFKNVEVTQGSGDHGIDILAEKDGISYAIQCKCYSSNIGNSAVQQAHTGKSLYHKDVAVVLTNRYFTPQAVEEAQALGVKLWDRDKLNEMINSQNN
ncbi:MAG: restriction endonuclease [Lachnoclostridium sp.]|nr:restriction endonuclease [Lachnoclostridium sp.]MCM1385267.1 restriction endonuclease [Lachnoclostridium sp.]